LRCFIILEWVEFGKLFNGEFWQTLTDKINGFFAFIPSLQLG